MRRIICALALLVGLSGGTLARANLVVDEPFNYPAGTLNGSNGGTGFSAAWSGGPNFAVAAGNLDAPTYQGTGNQVHFAGTFTTIARNLPTTYGTSGTDLWISYLTQPITVNAFSALDFGTTFGSSLTVGILGGSSGSGPPSTTWGMDTFGGTGVVLSSVPVSYGQTTLLVIHASFVNGADQIDLYINPGASLPASPDASKTNLDMHFSQIGFGANNGDVFYDELRMGTTYADVAAVPEPSALALLALPLVALATRRGKRT